MFCRILRSKCGMLQSGRDKKPHCLAGGFCFSRESELHSMWSSDPSTHSNHAWRWSLVSSGDNVGEKSVGHKCAPPARQTRPEGCVRARQPGGVVPRCTESHILSIGDFDHRIDFTLWFCAGFVQGMVLSQEHCAICRHHSSTATGHWQLSHNQTAVLVLRHIQMCETMSDDQWLLRSGTCKMHNLSFQGHHAACMRHSSATTGHQ